jgi:pyruvate/2-oxoglutarate dehydrogenase complex dihydrolipoamide dehydrogenase (E3) component
VPSKTLLKTATVYSHAARFKDFGLPRLEKLPAPSAAEVLARVQRVIASIAPHDSPERFRKLGVEVHLEPAGFVSENEVELDSGGRLSAPRFIVSTGSSPGVPPIPGLEETGYITNVDVFELEKFPVSLVILGAGPIGVEMAQAFARLGSEVKIIDMAGHVLPREDADMAEYVEKSLRDEGAEIYTGTNITSVEKLDRGKRVNITRSGRIGEPEEESVEGEEILVALGRRGNTEGLGLEAAGVETERSFITTDAKLRSSNRRVRAAGDVNGRYLFTHVAGAEGAFLVRALALHLPGSMSYEHVPWCTYTDPELASVGFNESRASEAGLEYRTVLTSFTEVDRARAEGFEEGQIKMLIDRKDRIIGVQIAGGHAGELLLPSVIAVQRKWKLGSMLKPMYPYPTMGEIHKRAAGNYLSPRLFNERIRSILSLVFRYRGGREEKG